jgi:DHA1 family bicyclomycin/chloramphenicol resistance-like MFS transporter
MAVTRTLVLLLGALTALGPLTIDMYLPSLPTLAEVFAATPAAVQLTLSAYLAGMATGQLLYGPLSDARGRKLPLSVGLAIYVAASVACVFAGSVTAMIGLRFIQALGGCAGLVISRAIVRDFVSGQESARLFSLLMLVMGVAPILAPLGGGYLLTLFGWQAIFLALAAFGLACLVIVATRLPETLPPEARRPAGMATALRAYWMLLGDRRFLGFSLAGGVGFATLFVYITASPHLFIDVYGLSPTAYAWLFGANAAGLIGASQVNRYLLQRTSLYRILRHALTFHAVAVLVFLLAALAKAPLAVLIAPLFLAVASLGLIGPNGTAASLSGDPRVAGSASSLMGTVPSVAGGGIGGLIGLLPGDTPASMAAGMAACAAIAWLSHRALVASIEE